MNNATKTNVALISIVFGLSSITHGFFEILQGSKPIDSLIISSVGERFMMWSHGQELAFSILPNFLAAGICAVAAGILLIVVSLFLLHLRGRALILLGLYLFSFLTGGGVAQILLFPWIVLVAARIDAPLKWWRNKPKPETVLKIGSLWHYSIGVCTFFIGLALFVSFTGKVPMVTSEDSILRVMIFSLAIYVIFFPLSVITGFAKDSVKTI